MNLEDLIPKIEVGKKYLWRARAMELSCPYCGHVFGSERDKGGLMQTLINVGDEIVNAQSLNVLLTLVSEGRHGLFLEGKFTGSNCDFRGYLPWELPPSEMVPDWYNWAIRETVTLATGLKLGLVAALTGANVDSVGKYDAEWERTIELIRKEEVDEVR